MDLKIPWKALSKQEASSPKRGAFSLKQIAFLVVVGVALVAGILLRFSGQFFGQPEAEKNAPVTVAAPPPPRRLPPPPRCLPPKRLSPPQSRLHNRRGKPQLRSSSRDRPARQSIRL